MGKPLGQPETVVAVTAGAEGTKGVMEVAGISCVAGLIVKKPHPLAHTCQFTPAFVGSLATAALRLTEASGCICDGSEGMKLTCSVVSGVIAMGEELMLTLGSATEVAVSTTLVPEDVTGGAV
jgi:hypothetical protein